MGVEQPFVLGLELGFGLVFAFDIRQRDVVNGVFAGADSLLGFCRGKRAANGVAIGGFVDVVFSGAEDVIRLVFDPFGVVGEPRFADGGALGYDEDALCVNPLSKFICCNGFAKARFGIPEEFAVVVVWIIPPCQRLRYGVFLVGA